MSKLSTFRYCKHCKANHRSTAVYWYVRKRGNGFEYRCKKKHRDTLKKYYNQRKKRKQILRRGQYQQNFTTQTGRLSKREATAPVTWGELWELSGLSRFQPAHTVDENPVILQLANQWLPVGIHSLLSMFYPSALKQIHGKHCQVGFITKKIAKIFLNKYAIGPYITHKAHIGLLYGSEIVCILACEILKKEEAQSYKVVNIGFHSDYLVHGWKQVIQETVRLEQG